MNEETTVEVPTLTLPSTSRRIEVHIDQVEPNPFQPRRELDGKHIDNVALSILRYGLFDAPTARLHPNHPEVYQLIDGQNRWEAIKRLVSRGQHPGYFELNIRDADDVAMLEIALNQNIVRKQLTPLDEAWGFRELEKMGVTQAAIGAKYGYEQSTVSNKIRLLTLPEAVIDSIRSKVLSAGHGVALLGIENDAERGQWAMRALENDWSVKKLEGEIRTYKADKAAQEQPSLPEVEEEPTETKPEVQVEVVPDVDPSELPPVQPRDPNMTDEELAAFNGTKAPGEVAVAEEESSEEGTAKIDEAESDNSADESEESTPAPAPTPKPEEPVVNLPPVMAPVPGAEYGWMRSKGLTTGVALAHLRRFYTICESNSGLARLLEMGGLGDIFDTLEAIYPGDTN